MLDAEPMESDGVGFGWMMAAAPVLMRRPVSTAFRPSNGSIRYSGPDTGSVRLDRRSVMPLRTVSRVRNGRGPGDVHNQRFVRAMVRRHVFCFLTCD